MDKEFLIDYQEKEFEIYQKIVEAYENGETELKYPTKERFGEINEPIAIASVDGPIWSQIPFYGSLIIPLYPVEEELFLNQNGLKPGDLDHLVDFSRRTGRVHFVLNGWASSFQDLDYLNPIFKELKPPQGFMKPIKYILGDDFKTLQTEFDTLARIPDRKGLTPIDYIKSISRRSKYRYSEDEFYIEHFTIYSYLKQYGYNDLLDSYLNLKLVDSQEASRILSIYGGLICDTKIISMDYNDRIFSKNYFTNRSVKTDPTFLKEHPIADVGVNLMKKLTYLSESYESCISVIDRYDQDDLYKITKSIHKGLQENGLDDVIDKCVELDQVLDNMWNDETIKKGMRLIKYGIPLTLGAIGSISSGIIGGSIGIISGTLLSGVGSVIKINENSLSELISKIGVKKHLIDIYDFNKKYPVKK